MNDLSAPGQDASTPAVALDPSANAVAVWVRGAGANLNVVQAATHWANAWSWEPPVDLTAAGHYSTYPQVAVDASGNALAIWTSVGTTSVSIVQAATLPAGGAWTASVDVSAAGQDARWPQLAVDPSGNAVAVWECHNPAEKSVHAATLPAGGSWTTPIDLSAVGGDARQPAVAVDASVNAVAVWSRYDGAHRIVQAATLSAAGSWTTPLDLSAAGNEADNPAVAFDASGNAVAVWWRFDGANNIVQAATLPAGGSWTASVDVSATGYDAWFPQVAVDTAGDAVCVWQRSDGANDKIVAVATLPAGGSWASPVDLSAPGQDASWPAVAVDAGGDALAVWQSSDGANVIARAARRWAGGTWGTFDLSAPGQDASHPQVAANASGSAVAVWSRSDGTSTIVQASDDLWIASPPE